VSAFAQGMRYVGGLVLLVLLLVLVIQPETAILGASAEAALRFRIVAVLAPVCVANFALPVLLSAHGAKVRRTSGGLRVRALLADYAGLVRRLVRMWSREHQTLRFFIASAVFRDGLAAIFSFAGVLAAGSYGFSPSEIIVLGVAANVSAGAGAMIAGWFDDRLGPKPVIIAGLVIIIIGGLPILFSAEAAVFWVCALILSFCVGPVQASSRSFLARITPPESAGENFGLYATTGRAVSFLGPAMFAGAIMVFGFQRAGTLGILLALAIGLALSIPLRPDAPRRSLQG